VLEQSNSTRFGRWRFYLPRLLEFQLQRSCVRTSLTVVAAQRRRRRRRGGVRRRSHVTTRLWGVCEIHCWNSAQKMNWFGCSRGRLSKERG